MNCNVRLPQKFLMSAQNLPSLLNVICGFRKDWNGGIPCFSLKLGEAGFRTAIKICDPSFSCNLKGLLTQEIVRFLPLFPGKKHLTVLSMFSLCRTHHFHFPPFFYTRHFHRNFSWVHRLFVPVQLRIEQHPYDLEKRQMSGSASGFCHERYAFCHIRVPVPSTRWVRHVEHSICYKRLNVGVLWQ